MTTRQTHESRARRRVVNSVGNLYRPLAERDALAAVNKEH